MGNGVASEQPSQASNRRRDSNCAQRHKPNYYHAGSEDQRTILRVVATRRRCALRIAQRPDAKTAQYRSRRSFWVASGPPCGCRQSRTRVPCFERHRGRADRGKLPRLCADSVLIQRCGFSTELTSTKSTPTVGLYDEAITSSMSELQRLEQVRDVPDG